MGLRRLFTLLQPSALRLSLRACPVCGPSVILRLAEGEVAVRCVRCTATPVHLAVVAAVKARLPQLRRRSAYELSSRGPLLAYLRRQFDAVTCSEYFRGVPSGTMVNGVRCEDVQRLTFEDAAFDLCTSTEVFEHVPDDMAGFRELHRVLRPGGQLVFTVPLTDAESTIERAAMAADSVTYFKAPAYHGDRLTGSNTVLVFRDYGADICARLLAAGFRHAAIVEPSTHYFGCSRSVVVAVK